MTVELAVNELLSDPLWNDIRASVFVTTYFAEPRVGHNVWCCMSNGVHNRSKTVHDNAIETASICRSDPRTKVSPTFKSIEISVLAPRDLWIKSANIVREEGYTIYIQSGNKSAFYLPSVWQEEEEWMAYDLIKSLKHKARITSFNYDIYKVPTILINEHGFEYKEWLVKEMGKIILDKVVKFYKPFIDTNGQLPYIIDTRGEIKYENGDMIRIFYNLADYNRLAGTRLGRKYLGGNNKYSLHEWVALASLVNSLNSPSLKQIKDKILSYNKHGIFSSDKSFANPQAMLAVADEIDEQSAKNFVKQSKNWNVDSFGANWISQALCALFNRFGWEEIIDILIDKYLPILKNIDHSSVTQIACSYHGILIMEKTLMGHSNIRKGVFPLIDHLDLEQYIVDHYYMQRELENGPFPYYIEQHWYRTDVTFHVTDVIELILNI